MFGFEKLFGGKKEEIVDVNERAHELILMVLPSIVNRADEEKERAAAGEKLPADDRLKELFKECLDLLKNDEVDPAMKNDLQDYVDEIRAGYDIE